MSPPGPESAANEAKIQREQLRIDTIDRKADGKVEGNDNATPEQVAERTQAYIGRVNDVQGRIRSLRQKVEIGKEMKNPNWPALEKACNDVEGGLAQRLVGVSVDNLQSGIPEFGASIDRFLQSLQTEDLRENRRYAAGPTDAAAVRRRSDEAYNVRLVEARKVGGLPHIDACDEVIRSNEAELAYLRTGLLPVGWRYDVWGTPEARIKAIEAALPGYRNERRDAVAALPKDQITIQKLCDRSDAAWVTFNTAKSANPVVKQAVVESLEKLIDVNLEELEHLGRYPNPGAINDKTGETISSRIGRIEQMLPTYRVEYAQARGEQAELGADTPKTTVQQLFEQLIAGTTIDAKELPAFVKTATEKYGETTLRLVVSRVALVNKLSPAVCQASGFPFRPPVDNKQLAVQLGRGVLPAQPTPEQAETVTHAYLLGKPEDLIRRKYEFVLDRTVGPQEQIAKYHTFIENETKNLANETRNDADREIVQRLANNIRSARESIKKEQETITGYQQILFHFEAALTVFDATVARNDGRQQESDRIYLKLREKYGPDLAKMDPDLGKRVTEAIAGLKSRPNQLSPMELAMVEGRDQDATKLAVDRQQGNRDSDLLAQARGVPRSVNVNILNGRGAVTDESGDVLPPLGGTRRNLTPLPVGGRRRGVIDLDSIDLDSGAKYRKQTREYLLGQNGQNGVTVAETTGANDFFKIIGVSTATIKGHFTCSFDGEWFFTEEKPASKNGPLNPNWFAEDPNVPAAERNAINALHRGLMDRSDPEVRRQREERESGPELGNYDRGSNLGDLLGPRDGIVSTSFTIEPFDSYMGRYEGERVPVDVYTGQMQGFGSPKVFKLGVGDKQHLVGFEDSFARKLAGAPPGMTAVLRREPTQPTFASVYRVPSNRFGDRPRYAQRVLTYDKLKADDLAFVRIGRSPEEMREVERRGLETLGKHSPEIVHRRNWDRNDELLNMDTTVRVKKGTLVVEYMFSSIDGVWLCRETERDGKNFNDLRNPIRSLNSGRFHPISVRYSPTDDARKAFNAIGEELTAMEGGMTGRSALQIAGEPRPEADNKLEVIGPTFLSSRNVRSATIADIEKRNVEDSHDVLRVIDNDAAVRGVLSEAGKINSSIGLVQRLFEAGKDGTKRPGLVDLMREESGKILGVLNDPAMKTNLLRARVRLQELKRANTGVDKSAIDQEIDKRIKALDDMEAMLSKPDLRQFCEHIMDKSEFDIDTFWTWLERNIVTIVAIVVSCLAVVLAVFTFGITSPLAVAAISATAGVISSELTSEARFQLHQEFDSDVTSGRATFRNRSRTGAFIRATIKDEKIYNPETGRMEHADVLTHLIDPLGQDFVTGFVTTLAFMGAGAAIGKGLTVLANTRCVQGLIANSPRLNRVIAYLAKAEQGAPAAQGNMKGFMSSWGRETAEEIRDETAERIAGDWASVVFIAKKNFRPKNPTAPKTLANSDAAVRNMGEFQYETGGDPAKAVAEIQQWAAMEGANVTIAANGAITIELDGRVFLLSPDVPVTGLTPTTSAPASNRRTETAPDVRAAGAKLAEAARADPRNVAALKDFLKTTNVDSATRIDIAEKLLGRTLNDAERKALIGAHNSPGAIDNLSGPETFAKGRLLLASFSKADAKALMDAGVCGEVDVQAMNRLQRSDLFYELRNNPERTAEQNRLFADVSRAMIADIDADPNSTFDDKADVTLAKEVLADLEPAPTGPVLNPAPTLTPLPTADALKDATVARLRAIVFADLQAEVGGLIQKAETATDLHPDLRKKIVDSLKAGNLADAEAHAVEYFRSQTEVEEQRSSSLFRDIRALRMKFELQSLALKALPDAARVEGLSLASDAQVDTKNIAALKEFLKKNDVNDATRIDIAEKLLGRQLSDTERKAVIDAHRAPGTIDNLTDAEVFGKARILLDAMSKADAKILMDAGVCGKGPFDARRMMPNEDYAVRQPDGKLVVATFLRVQGGQYIFAIKIGGRNVECTAPLNNVVGYAELVNRGSENDGVILTHLQSGEPVRMDPDGTGTIRTLVYVRTSTTDENIVIMRDKATRTEYRLQKKKVFDAVLNGMDETPAPAPNNGPQFTDRQVLEQLGFGLKVKIDGKTYTCVGENEAQGKLIMEDATTGRVFNIDKAKVLAAGRQALVQELQPQPAPIAPEISDTKVLEELAFGLEVELEGGRFVYSRPSSRPGHLAMKNVVTGDERRFTEADVIAAGRKAMAAAERLPVPAPAPKPKVSDAAVEAHVRDPDTRVTMVIDGRTRTLAFVRTSGVDPNVFILRDVTSGVEVRQPKANVLAAARNSLSPTPQPAPLPGPEAPLRLRDLRVGETYQIRRSSGAIEQWTYLGGEVDGEPKFRGKEGGRTVEYGFPIDRVSRLPVAAEIIDLKPAPRLRLSPGAIEVNGVEVKPGDLLLTRSNSQGQTHQLTFVGIDPRSPEHAIVAGPTGTRYRVNIAEMRTWNENTGGRPGEPAARFAPQDTVRDRQGNVFMVFEVRADGTLKCASTNGPPKMVTLSRADLTLVSRNPVVEVTTIYEGPALRRVITAGNRLLVVVDKSSANPNGIVQEGWVAQTNPRTGALEAYNPITRQYVPITDETVFHPSDFQQSNLQILRTNPEAKLLQRKFEYLNTPGRLPLSQDTFHEFFSPNADFAQANVGNCYLVAALHSLRLSPHFEVLVRSAVTPVIENLPDPENRGKKKDFIVGFDVRIPMGDPKGKIVRVHMEDIQEGSGQQTVANLYLGLQGPLGFKVLEAAYTLAEHGRDGKGQINRKASDGGRGSQAIQALIGSAGGKVSAIRSGASLTNSFSEGSNLDKAGPAVIEFLNNFSTDKQFATVNTPRLGDDRDTFTVKDVYGKNVEMHYTHAYSIESTDPAKKTVTVVNPHDTSKTITLKYSVFLETFSDIDIVDVNFHGLLK